MRLLGYLATMALLALPAAGAEKRKTLDFYFVDTEGGQATLMVTPEGESLLVDAGWPGNDGRDAKRIIAAAKKAGLDHIDYLLVSHYHLDHVGGVPDLMERFPVKALIDHGENTETSQSAKDLTAKYMKAMGNTKRISVRPGDKIALKGLDITVLVAAGDKCAVTFAGGGKDNPFCANEPKKGDDPTENARSIGILVQFGKFRFVDLGDLTWNKELELMCPKNPVGGVDLYLTTHHGLDASGPKSVVHALHPKVAVMNNGAKKGGSPKAWDIVSSSPGLQDLWQLHYSIAGGAAQNVAADRIANLEGAADEGHWLEVKAEKKGGISVWNSRNQYSKRYK